MCVCVCGGVSSKRMWLCVGLGLECGVGIGLGHHRKITGNHKKMIGIPSVTVGHLNGRFIEIISFKAPGNYSGSMRTYNFPICLWENP